MCSHDSCLEVLSRHGCVEVPLTIQDSIILGIVGKTGREINTISIRFCAIVIRMSKVPCIQLVFISLTKKSENMILHNNKTKQKTLYFKNTYLKNMSKIIQVVVAIKRPWIEVELAPVFFSKRFIF